MIQIIIIEHNKVNGVVIKRNDKKQMIKDQALVELNDHVGCIEHVHARVRVLSRSPRTLGGSRICPDHLPSSYLRVRVD